MDIGNYVVDKTLLLGHGSYGSVFKGYRKVVRIPVAVKEITDAAHLNKSTLQEIESLMSIKHSNIVELLCVYQYSNSWWIILEYCDHGDLQIFLKTKKPDSNLKVHIMLQCASAISYLHNCKPCMVHRDIKLNNILLKKTPSLVAGVTVKICDFGLSKIIDDQHVPLTSDTGTLAFRAPELLMKKDGKYQYTAAVDTFALGLVFKVMLDFEDGMEQFVPSEVPVKGEPDWMLTYGMTLERQKKDKKKGPALFLLRPDDTGVMLHLKYLVTRMVAYDSKDRPTMQDVTDVLEIIQDHMKTEHSGCTDLLLYNAKQKKQVETLATEVRQEQASQRKLQAEKKELESEKKALQDEIAKLKKTLLKYDEKCTESAEDLRQLKAESQRGEVDEVKKPNDRMAQAVSYGRIRVRPDDNYCVVVAIDFSKSNSSYAFSCNGNTSEIYLNKCWGAVVGLTSFTTPTCVMTNPDGSFHSYGYDAERDFSDLDIEENVIGGPGGYNLYRHFMMQLYKQEVNRSCTVLSTMGHATLAIDIVTMGLHYLLNHFMDYLDKACTRCPKPSDIRWVLTVPAVWSNANEEFMREAAYRAGLTSEKNSAGLLFALYPEAVLSFCQSLKYSNFCGEEEQHQDHWKIMSGDKVIIINAEDDTVDFTAHEVQSDDSVKHLCPPSGGPWGSKQVEGHLVRLLQRIFGSDVIDDLQSNHTDTWFNIMLQCEKIIKTVVPGRQITLELPFTMAKIVQRVKGLDIDTVVAQSGIPTVSFRQGRLIMKQEMVKELFAEPISQIIGHVQQLIHNSTALAGLKYMLLVGGYGESRMLQEALQRAFSGIVKILLPLEAQLAVVKGGTVFGHNPLFYIERIPLSDE